MTDATKQPRVAILGLGNELLMDDGVGVHAVRALQIDPPDGIVLADVGTAVLRAQHLLEEADVVIAIDAVEAAGRPGTVYRLYADDAEVNRGRSLHDFGLIGVMRLMPERARPKVIILGVEPERIDYGMELSPSVRAALPHAVEEARRIAEELKNGTGYFIRRREQKAGQAI